MSARGALATASWRAVGRRAPVLAPAGAAALLLLVGLPLLDGPHAGQVLHGVILLAATVLIGATEDPAAEICATSPYPCRRRTALRVASGAVLAVPLAVAGLVLAHVRNPELPWASYAVEAGGLGVVALALGIGVRRWLDLAHPAYVATIGLIGVALAAFLLPRAWVLLEPQAWGPPWAAARWRWLGVAVLGLGVSLAATSDPAAESRHAG